MIKKLKKWINRDWVLVETIHEIVKVRYGVSTVVVHGRYLDLNSGDYKEKFLRHYTQTPGTMHYWGRGVGDTWVENIRILTPHTEDETEKLNRFHKVE